MTYKLLPMDRGHLPGVAAIERVCFSAPWSEAMLAEELYNDRACYLVAEDEAGEVLGYAGLHVVLDEGYVTNIAVDPARRRQGIAERLLAAFLRFGQEKLSFLTLEVRASNQAAIALYRKHGFAPAGRRKNYYDHPTEDAILMTREFKKDYEHSGH